MGAIETHLLPLGVTIPQADKEVAGGYFIWLHLPESLDAEVIAKRASDEERLLVARGPQFKVQGDETMERGQFEHDLRLSFAWADEEALAEGVERLGKVIKRALAEQ